MIQDPNEWFDGRARVMFVHAHPDDESITTGGTLAGLAAAGREPLLVTLTRGERGEVVEGPLSVLAGAHGLPVVRQNELKTALGMLGAVPENAPHSQGAVVRPSAEIRHAFLGVPPARAEGLAPTIYEDSGMEWGADGRAQAAPEAGPDALTSIPAVESLNDLLVAAHAAQAGAIVSYDDGGGYGHPDHVHAHRLARAVALALGLPFWEIAQGSAEPDAGDGDPEHDRESHDIAPWFDRKVAALRAHATQLTVDGEEIVHVGGQRQPIDRVEVFRRVSAPEAQ